MVEISTLDLEFYGADEIVASFLAPVDGGIALFETGPASTVANLEQRVDEAGYALDDLRAVFVTHVHLDHSGGAGVLAQRTGCTVYAHPAGADHLIDPERKLLPSAARLYGDQMQRLWGTTLGVPEASIEVVEDGRSVTVGGLEVTGWHTPGHANHHVAWQIGDSVVTGDVGGVRFQGATHVLPPMPPPDIDVELWLKSLAKLRSLDPTRLLLTHFGAFDDPPRHLDELEARIVRWTETAEGVVADGGDKVALATSLEEIDQRDMEAAEVPAEAVERYRRLCPMNGSSYGLYRYCTLERESGKD